MKKKFLTIILSLAVIMTTVFAGMPAYAAAAEGTPISTPEEFMAMEKNPSGSYYLTNDIELPANTMIFSDRQGTKFSGTFDGNGYAIKNFTYITSEYKEVGLFGYCNGANFKNVNMKDVNIKGTGQGFQAGALTYSAGNCTFTNVKISGKMSYSGNAGDVMVYLAGIGVYVGDTMKNCKNSADITADVEIGHYGNEIQIAGLGIYGTKTKLTDCSNSGNLTLKGYTKKHFTVSGLMTGGQTFTSCKNTGKITLISDKKDITSSGVSGAAGIAKEADGLFSCYNTGKISVDSGYKASSYAGGNYAAGLAAHTLKLSKCYNTGAVTFEGIADNAYAAGLACSVGSYAADKTNKSQNYNKGAVSAWITSASKAYVGGLFGTATCGIKNNYNAGKISMAGEVDGGFLGGIAGSLDIVGTYVTCNYNAGTISAGSGIQKGGIAGTYSGADMGRKRNIYNNYYKGCSKGYGASPITWHEWTAKATKVSKITKANCPKLSSKYWTYSSKKGRLILKNNKEK